jgi:phosphopantothenoylcysteine decarboxylase/phosphopantothenate--cysteine ligase
MGHIELARWADLVLIAPASADFIARAASGQADDLLTTLCLATDATIALAPAMNQAMWRDQATQQNLQTLADRHVAIFGPAEGSQACGDVGPGRMLEPEQLAVLAAAQFQSGQLDGLNVVITAGPTREAIDPVRYISNHSSGKMGFALAEAAIEAGASVTLLAGPVSLPTPDKVDRINVTSAVEMYQASLNCLGNCDIFIGSAAVADYRPAQVESQKIKKSTEQTTTTDTMTIELIRNPDIIADVASHPQRPFTVGFAAETQKLTDYAQAKLTHKNLDAIIANDVSDPTIGFNSDNNELTFMTTSENKKLPRSSKQKLARLLIAEIAQQYEKQQ